jgi:thiol-disulfide isomerase/thioredoxin
MRRQCFRSLFVAALVTVATTASAAADPPQNLVMHEAPQPVPKLQFADADGRMHTFGEFRGKTVLLNIWATWCLPCRTEMPTLDRLQATLGGSDFEVVALSIDRRGVEVVKKFYADNGIEHLAIRTDTSGQANSTLATYGLPTTLLLDQQGQELGRLVGPAEWDAQDMLAFLRSIIAAKHASAGRSGAEDRT